MNTAGAVAKALAGAGIQRTFGLPGGEVQTERIEHPGRRWNPVEPESAERKLGAERGSKRHPMAAHGAAGQLDEPRGAPLSDDTSETPAKRAENRLRQGGIIPGQRTGSNGNSVALGAAFELGQRVQKLVPRRAVGA